ncbi:MAG: flagellar protein FlaG [Deltaproteobacteria bacterium]|nr:flagellar protein FlaG [Deltaproteobacteria bacterium]
MEVTGIHSAVVSPEPNARTEPAPERARSDAKTAYSVRTDSPAAHQSNALGIGKTSIAFEQDKELDRIVVKILDKETGAVIRELPPEELRQIAKRLQQVAGYLFNKRI